VRITSSISPARIWRLQRDIRKALDSFINTRILNRVPGAIRKAVSVRSSNITRLARTISPFRGKGGQPVGVFRNFRARSFCIRSPPKRTRFLLPGSFLKESLNNQRHRFQRQKILLMLGPHCVSISLHGAKDRWLAVGRLCCCGQKI